MHGYCVAICPSLITHACLPGCSKTNGNALATRESGRKKIRKAEVIYSPSHRCECIKLAAVWAKEFDVLVLTHFRRGGFPLFNIVDKYLREKT